MGVIVIINVLLLFTAARYAVICHAVIFGMILGFALINDDLCTYTNINYIVHALLIPFYVSRIFSTVDELKKLSKGIISMYLIAFDVVTDIIVIYYFIQSGDYYFAVFQILCIFIGKLFGAFSHSIFNDGVILTRMDKILSFFGLGRSWFLINSWRANDKENMYMILYRKSEIWEIMFELFPGIALQIYALLTLEIHSLSLIVSIFFSVLTINHNVWSFLIGLQLAYDRQSQQKEVGATATQSTGKRRPFECIFRICCIPSFVFESGKWYLHLYAFMISDFYLRTIPIVVFMSFVTSNILRIVLFVVLFGGLGVFEFVMNKRMRIVKYQGIGFIVQIFSISVFSSFYNLFCTLDILKDEGFFGKSVLFEWFLFEHKMRIYLCAFFGVIDFFLIFLNGIGHNVASLLLMLVLIGLCVLNLFILKVWNDAEALNGTDKSTELSAGAVEMTDKQQEGDDKATVTNVNAVEILQRQVSSDYSLFDDAEYDAEKPVGVEQESVEKIVESKEVQKGDIKTSTQYDNIDRTESVSALVESVEL